MIFYLMLLPYRLILLYHKSRCRTSVLFCFFCNSSPTYRGRRILAIYYVKEENPTYEELKEWYSKSGLPLKKFFNTSGMLYKEMGLKDKLKDMSEDEQLKLLATDGMLVKRPLVIGDDFVLTGFKEKEWIEAMHV